MANQEGIHGSHVIDKHVGKTDMQLAHRLRGQPTIDAASSFPNLTVAQKTTQETIEFVGPPAGNGQKNAALSPREGGNWRQVVTGTVKGNPSLRNMNSSELRESIMEVSRENVFDLAKLISAGGLLHDPRVSLRHGDHERDSCLLDVLDTVGEGARYFTNHGQAEEGENADFLSPSLRD
ncbi:RNase A-like domain-containing protein [Streptomyces sp. WG7]|uniref:RNase A-like domain-containing protein n=1 Tax=Streptomyces sp. WG7 TaxID=3417650 RepID=UPI003CF27877